jgi:hypothetical protein
MRMNNVGWPTFVRKFLYLHFTKELLVYRTTYHSVVGDDLVAIDLRDKCVNDDVRKIIGNIESWARYGA